MYVKELIKNKIIHLPIIQSHDKKIKKMQSDIKAQNDQIRKLLKEVNRLKKDNKELRGQLDKTYASGLKPEDYKRAISDWFYKNVGYRPDLDHPKTFEEKIQWLKLYDSTPEKTRLADKYLVRDFIKERIGEKYLIPLLGVYDTFEEIDLDSLPDRFVMKCNHGCGYNIIVDDKTDFNPDDAGKKIRKWLTSNYAWNSGFELHYKDIPPKIVIEENIAEKGKDLNDFKFWCVDGKPLYLFVLSGRYTDNPTVAFYDTDWKLQPFVNSIKYQRCTDDIPRPKDFDEMLDVAAKLSKGFKFVRVDLYETPAGIKFGEMTFTPASGKFHWNPPEYGRICGDLIHLPCDEA